MCNTFTGASPRELSGRQGLQLLGREAKSSMVRLWVKVVPEFGVDLSKCSISPPPTPRLIPLAQLR